MVLDFGLLASNLFPSSDASGQGMGANAETVIWNDVGVGIVPIGAVVAWCKSLAGCPPLLPNFVECNGQVLDDGDSPFNTQTIPDLNGGNRFLRGDATSGTTGGTTTHVHPGPGTEIEGSQEIRGLAANHLPPYYTVVWVMRIK